MLGTVQLLYICFIKFLFIFIITWELVTIMVPFADEETNYEG